jgi:hypothetical protein
VNALARLPHQTHEFQPMEEVLLEKDMRRVAVHDVVLTLLEMTDLVTTRILQLR